MCQQSTDCVSYISWIKGCVDTFQKLSDEDQERAIIELISSCGIASKVRLSKCCHDFINKDFLVKLPLEVLENVVDYLSLVDTLIACHVSAEWNEQISMLHFMWKKKWGDLYMDSHPGSLQPIDNWKAECEKALVILLKFSAQTMVDTPIDFSVKIHITAMDFCDNVLFCCGNPTNSDSITTTSKNIAYVYRKDKDWTLVTSFEVVPVRFCVLSCCLIPGFKVLAGGHDGILTIWDLEVPETDLPAKVTLITAVQAHTSCIGSLCGSKDLSIAVSAGRDSRVVVWDLETGARLGSFPSARVCEVSILSGERSPFEGYNCILIRKSGESCTIAMACWGRNIPLEQAIYSPLVSHTHRHDVLLGPCTILPNVFVEGGSLVYGFRKYVPGLRTETCKLIWQPLDPDDFMIPVAEVSSEDLHEFRQSLRPCRKDKYIDLPANTIGIQAVGLYFSIVVCNNSPNLLLVANDTGSREKLLEASMIFNRTDEAGKIGDYKWLDGIKYIQPGNLCFVRVIGQERIVSFCWRPDVFACQKPSLSELLACRTRRSGFLASSSAIPEGSQH